jgi:hypothetical protein
MDARSFGWCAANSALWIAVGATAALVIERTSRQRPSLGDLADEAVVRMQALDLTAPQKLELERIREAWRGRILAEEQGWLDRLDEAAADADAKVAALLTPDQVRRYRELALAPRSK